MFKSRVKKKWKSKYYLKIHSLYIIRKILTNQILFLIIYKIEKIFFNINKHFIVNYRCLLNKYNLLYLMWNFTLFIKELFGLYEIKAILIISLCSYIPQFRLVLVPKLLVTPNIIIHPLNIVFVITLEFFCK